jgi:DNA-binding transcriptional LysR family regulator
MQQMLFELVFGLSMHDLRRLRAFHAVAEQRSFSAAGLELGYAQSVVSHHVSALEQELGLTLVDRGTRPVGLTDAGRRLLPHAIRVLGEVAAAEEELRAIAGLESGTLRVGAFLTACTSFMPAALARFGATHPDVHVQLLQMEPEETRRRLRAGEIDLGVIWWDVYEPAPAEEADGFERAHLTDDPYRLVLPPTHRLARRRELRLAEMAKERFAGPMREASRYRAMFDELCAAAGFTPDVAYTVTDVSVARSLVAAGLCVALMPELAVPPPRPDVAVKPVRDIEPRRSVHALWMRGRRVPGVAPMLRLLEAAAPR